MRRTLKTKTIISDGGRSILGERLDCTVRALAHAACVSYEQAHAVLAEAGRKNGHKFQFRNFLLNHPNLLGAKFSPVWNVDLPARTTVVKWVAAHPKGMFVVQVRGHVFTVCDGVIYDIYPNDRCFMTFAFQVE